MDLAAFSDELADLVDRVVPLTVSIAGKGEKPGLDASGSGFVVDEDGHLVTNFHVIEGLLSPLSARLPGSRSQKATIVGRDPHTDLAVLRLEHPPPGHLQLRREAPRLGEVCIAVGSPFGTYTETVTIGVVSGLSRSMPQNGRARHIERAIQTDAAINPGNSGGPLVDVRGQVIGVSYCSDRRGEGLSFAIPADTVRYVAGELIEHGEVVRAALGLTVTLKHIDLHGEEVPRLTVTRCKDPGIAIKEGDVLLSIDDQIVDERADLFEILTRDKIDTPVKVRVLRHNTDAEGEEGAVEERDVEVTPSRWDG